MSAYRRRARLRRVDSLPGLLAAVDAGRDELVDIWQRLIRIPTVNTGLAPTGHETPCAEFARDLLRAEGVTAEVVESAPGRGNLLAEYRGGDGPTLLLMSHLDVVPPGDESRWTFPPFSAELRDGWVYGRGANDCKSLVAAELYVLLLLARLGVALPGAVRLAACADEEAGGEYGFRYLAAHHADRIRADLALNEGGGSLARLRDGGLGCLVACGEKGRLEATITLFGRSQHASAPWLADNPVDRLPEVLGRLAGYRPEIRLDHAGEQFAEVLGISPPAAAEVDPVLARFEETRAGDVSRLRGLTRMTWVPTMLAASEKSNAVPDRVRVTLDVRTLPGQTPEYVMGELKHCLGDLAGVDVQLAVTAECNASPLTPSVARLFERALAALGEGPVRCLPSLCSGFTDARLVRPLAVPVYGFAPLPRETDLDRCGCHNIDEQFPVEAVVYRTKSMLALAWLLCDGEG